MRVLVISDIHGDISAINDLLLKEGYCDAYLNAGDSCCSKNMLNPFLTVKGNCDQFYGREYPLSASIDSPYGKIYIRHFPYTREEAKRLSNDGYKILIHGHTHKQFAEKIGDSYVFCPGSLSFPRDSDKGTYLIINIDNKVVEWAFKKLP